MGKTLWRITTVLIMVILTGAFINVNQSLAEEEASDGRFIAYDDGTVWDTHTNLLWAARDNGSNIYWSDAEAYCKTYDGGGYKGWRMPTRDELKRQTTVVIITLAFFGLVLLAADFVFGYGSLRLYGF